MELEHRCLFGGLYSATRESCHLARRALLECGYWILEGTGQWGAPRVKQSPLCTGMSTLSMSSLMACWFSDALLHSALLGPALELEPCCMANQLCSTMRCHTAVMPCYSSYMGRHTWHRWTRFDFAIYLPALASCVLDMPLALCCVYQPTGLGSDGPRCGFPPTLSVTTPFASPSLFGRAPPAVVASMMYAC